MCIIIIHVKRYNILSIETSFSCEFSLENLLHFLHQV